MFSSPSFNSVIVRKSHCRCQFSSLRVNRISLATTQNQVRSTIVIKFSISKFNYLKDRGNKSYIPASKKVCIIFVSVEPGFHFYTILGLCPVPECVPQGYLHPGMPQNQIFKHGHAHYLTSFWWNRGGFSSSRISNFL